MVQNAHQVFVKMSASFLIHNGIGWAGGGKRNVLPAPPMGGLVITPDSSPHDTWRVWFFFSLYHCFLMGNLYSKLCMFLFFYCKFFVKLRLLWSHIFDPLPSSFVYVRFPSIWHIFIYLFIYIYRCGS